MYVFNYKTIIFLEVGDQKAYRNNAELQFL